jgi:hypothetical protein
MLLAGNVSRLSFKSLCPKLGGDLRNMPTLKACASEFVF